MRKRIIFSLVILILVLFPLTVSANTKTTQEIYEGGFNRGYEAGSILAKLNNLNNRQYSFEQITKPSLEAVLKENSDLIKDDDQHKYYFYMAYLEGYEKGYRDYIAIGTPGSGGQTDNNNANYGAFFGIIHGEIAGIRDYEDGKSPNYLRALPKDADINASFELNNLPPVDRIDFIKEFKENFRKGYEDAYYNAHYGLQRDSLESGRTDGAYFGEIVGSIFGTKDYFEGRKLDYSRNMPTDGKIKVEYSLNRQDDEYTQGFIDGFKNAYRESYISSFREAQNNVEILEDSNAYQNGYSLGEVRGTIQGRIDFLSRQTNSWMRTRPPASTIIRDYKLLYQTSKYMDNFVNGFWAGYSQGYTDTYKDLSQEAALNKITSHTIPIEGGLFQSSDNRLTVDIDGGTYYKDIILNIEVVDNPSKIDSKYISASNFYIISTVNPSRQYNGDKEIQISFEYYGDSSGGIYILKDGKWEYLKSEIEDNMISALISPSTLSEEGNFFTVLVDKELIDFYDIRGHWAKEEIYTLIRKGIINGYPDKTFKPDNYITRAEFLVLLSRAYKWELDADLENLSAFKDRDTFNAFSEKQISYALSHGYIRGYSDNYFRPNNYISYKEVEVIMRRILMNDNFTWDAIANKIMYDKKVRLDSFDSLDNKITRAEFSYLLHELINEI